MHMNVICLHFFFADALSVSFIEFGWDCDITQVLIYLKCVDNKIHFICSIACLTQTNYELENKTKKVNTTLFT